jgi:hypothetical protein
LAGCPIAEDHSTRGAASWNHEENRLAHVSTFLFLALGRERRECEGSAGAHAACQQPIHTDVYSQARKGAKRQAQQRIVQMILPETLNDAVPVISLEGPQNDAAQSASLIMRREVGPRSGIALKKQELRPLMERFGATKNSPRIAKRLRNMVGTRRLELLTSTVSIAV